MGGNLSFIKNYLKDTSLSINEYEKQYKDSIKNPNKFWEEKSKTLTWIKKFSQVKNSSFEKNVKIEWFSGGLLNASFNCLDRHLNDKGDKIAIIWESDDPSVSKKISYSDLHKMVCKFANGLKSLGLKKGDRVTIYLPMIPEAAYAMLACSRIGAIHSVVFGGFAP